jgi:regulatory protein
MAMAEARKRYKPLELRTGVITGLSSKGAGGERVAVHIEGQHAFDLSAALAVSAGLHKDEVLTDERQRDLLQSDEPNRAREAAFGMLARREMSAHELAGKLSLQGISDDAVSDTLEWLRESGYVDDRRFAAMFAADRLKAGWGRQRIVSELMRKGVERDMLTGESWRELLETKGATDGVEEVVALVRRRFSAQLESDPVGAKNRISAFLARRGHDWETIAAVLKAVKQSAESFDEDDAWRD